MKSKGFPVAGAPTILVAIAIFFLLYNVTFKFNETLTTGRLSLLVLFFWAALRGSSPFDTIKSRTWLIFLPLPAVVLQYLYFDDFGQLSRFLHLALYSYLGAALAVALLGDIKKVLVAILIAISLQSVILIVSFVSFEYRIWFDTVAVTGAHYDANYLYRAPGFASAGGASLSVIQSLGVFAGWVLLTNKRLFTLSRRSTYLVLLGMALSTASCIVVGRTGLLLCLVFLFLFVFSKQLRLSIVLYSLLCMVFAYSFFAPFLSSMLSDEFSTDYFTSWAFGFLNGDDDIVAALAAMPIPPLSTETWHGTGLTSIVNGVNPSGHDSGFIQAYYSMGLPFAALLYVCYLYVLFQVLRWLPIAPRFLLVATFFLIETKEPFLFKYSTMFVLLSLHYSYVQTKKPRRNSQLAASKI